MPSGTPRPGCLRLAVMIAILGGLGAALLWATATVSSSRASRLIGASSTVGWMMLVGLVISLPLAAAAGPLPAITPTMLVELAGSGLGSVIGLQLVYRGLRLGKIGAVSALASTEGAVAAGLAILAGERVTLPAAITLAVIAAGVATVAFATGESADHEPVEVSGGHEAPGIPEAVAHHAAPHLASERRAAMFGMASAFAFGISLFSSAQLGHDVPLIYTVLPARVVGVFGVFIPMALSGRLWITRAAIPFVVVIGVAEVVGTLAFVVGSLESIAVSAVLASQFAAIAAIAAFLLFRERLTTHQRTGVVAIAMGVAALTALRG